MNDVYILDTNVITPLGKGVENVYEAIRAGRTSIAEYRFPKSPLPPYFVSKFSEDETDNFRQLNEGSLLENAIVEAAGPIMSKIDHSDLKKTILIVATTKGNIDQINSNSSQSLISLAKNITGLLQIPNKPLVVSNACASGVSALLVAQNLLQSDKYQYALVCGGDLLTEFVLSGFHAFQAVSKGPCKPYDKNRSGMTPGEGIGTFLISRSPVKMNGKSYSFQGSQANDANHISGPSRTGRGLQKAIREAMRHTGVSNEEISALNCHGTGTIYNDEMEAIALNKTGLADTPINSYKGAFGHCFGAAGLIESAICLEQMKRNEVLPSMGFSEVGTSMELTIPVNSLPLSNLDCSLKTSSGFGGNNSAVIFKKS